MNEKKLWQNIKKNIPEAFFTRIESSTTNGIPDIFGIYSVFFAGPNHRSQSNSFGFNKLPIGTWFVKMKVNNIQNNSVVFENMRTLEINSYKIYNFAIGKQYFL